MIKFAALTAILLSVQTVFAGSLNPPGPPTAGTMKPLDQVEPRTPITSVPFTISQGGSYYLTKSMSCAQTAITVSVDDVTIDLCGFTLTGTGTTGIGIDISMRNNVEIRNGTISGFPQAGIMDQSPNAGNGHRVIGVRLIANGTYGIALSGSGHLVRDCTVSGTLTGVDSARGITVGMAATVADNTVFEIGSGSAQSIYGIYASVGSRVTGNTVRKIAHSAGASVNGIYASAGSVVADNTVYGIAPFCTGSSVYGIRAAWSVTITGNCIYDNGPNASGARCGLHALDYCLIDRNTCYNNGSNLVCSPSAILGVNSAP